MGLGITLSLALFGRVLLLASNAVSFHSDEAVVALMARHILQGARPVFFYGQAYMGSVDAWLVALGFALFGESVAAIRIVQSVLYLLVVACGYIVAWRLSGRVVVAVVAGLVLAVPPVLVATYTTATLGGYNETLLLGNLLLLLSYEVTHEHRRSLGRWGLLGFCAGVGWWTNGLIVAYALPVGVLILKRLIEPKRHEEHEDVGVRHALPLHEWRNSFIVGITMALVGFFVGSAPWWIFAFQNDFAPLRFYLGSVGRGSFAGTDVFNLPFGERLIGLFFLGVPTLIGMRFPWTPDYFVPLFGAVVFLIYGLALFRLIRQSNSSDGTPILKSDARLLILSMIGVFCILFLVSRFSSDPTGRYFLSLVLPLGIMLGTLVASIRRVALQIAVIAVVLAYSAAGQISAATTNPPGFTTQFNLVTHIPNDCDDELIAFLAEQQLYNGYTNYWISFRLAFLSAERMQYSAALPYKPDLSYTPLDERYPPYRAAVDAAERITYITANVPEIDQELETVFAEANVNYATAEVGPYRIYYDFTPPERAPRPPLPFVNSQ
jgi:4-amino-4-deoxy-L-arabinose transferase-like glycosyltransferase